MHIAIDDTYGPQIKTESQFVTGQRRTHVAVAFSDDQVDSIRQNIKGCLEEVHNLTGVPVEEFHFVDIYNRNPPWDQLQDSLNLKMFEFFAEIYSHYRWPVIIQTIDDRTLKDHGIKKICAQIDGFSLEKPEDLSLFFLFSKIKNNKELSFSPLHFIIDEGKKKSGTEISKNIFSNWPNRTSGIFASSKEEPLLQVADFFAFSINRCTHLSMKKKRTEIDNWFLALIGNMGINSNDIKTSVMTEEFTINDFDNIHREDRVTKGL